MKATLEAPRFRKTAETFTRGATSLPQKYFVSKEIFAAEQQRIFSQHWLCVGHESEIARAGDYIVKNIFGESVIILRDQKNCVHAFYNVCRHRGSRLCDDTRGQFRQGIQCPYHAWTYSLAGQLIGAPHMDAVPDFDKADYPLNSAKIGVWEGFIFLNLANNPAPLEKYFTPLLGKFSHWNLPKLRSAKRIEYDVRANWKLIFENYSECYHCPLVHPELTKLSPSESAENDLVEGPFLGGFMSINSGAGLTKSGNACALPLGNIAAEDHQRVFYYSIFPNMLLSLHPDYVMMHQLWPQGCDRTLIFCDWYFHPDAFGRADFRPDDAIDFWDLTNRQDWRVCELSQLGISSRAYRPGPYSPRESIPAAWDREYLRVLGKI